MHYHRRPRWALPESAVTPEHIAVDRRAFLAGTALTAAGLALGAPSIARADAPLDPFAPKPPLNPDFADAGRPVTSEDLNARYNNFYEFGTSKDIADRAQALPADPWTLTVDGLVGKPLSMDVDDLIKKLPIEERIVRHRCVEAWSMVAPWIGFELSHLLKMVEPQPEARFVRFESFNDSSFAPNQRTFWYPWPYVEGLTLAEAGNPLSFMVVGAYGKVLHKQFGAPIRLHTPWKYGFKHIKSVTKITLTDEQPVSFWEELQGREYGFWANVNPEVSHPRWSQATERVLGSDERIPTELFNGYGEEVAALYQGERFEKLGDRLYR
ncbi:MAG: protein-methionine-sulfoxide reductase catalytic subunit MsrP [Pseudomonadota bacterium]